MSSMMRKPDEKILLLFVTKRASYTRCFFHEVFFSCSSAGIHPLEADFHASCVFFGSCYVRSKLFARLLQALFSFFHANHQHREKVFHKKIFSLIHPLLLLHEFSLESDRVWTFSSVKASVEPGFQFLWRDYCSHS